MDKSLQADGVTSGEITFDEIKSPAEYDKEAALKLVVQDAERTETWISAQGGWGLRWAEADALYQSPQFSRVWEGTANVTKSNVSRFTVAKHVNSVVPTLLRGIFYDDPPFLLRPRPGTTQETIRAKTALMSMQLEEVGFYKAVKSGFRSMALFGTGIWKFGWLTEQKARKRYLRKRQPLTVNMPMSGEEQVHTEDSDEFEVKEFMERVDRPLFEHVDIRHVLVDPGCRAPDIREAKFVIHREYLSLNDLNALRDVEGYEIPAEDVLQTLFEGSGKETPATPGTQEQASQSTGGVHHALPRNRESTVDPAEHGLEVLERWDNDKVVVVLQRKWVLRNEPNPFGKIPFYSANWWDIPDAFWGMGIGRIVGSDQRVEAGLTNAALDILAMAVNPQYARRKGANVPTQQIRQRLGGIIDVETEGSVKDAFAMIEPPRVPAEVWAAIANSETQAESATGANEQLVQGSMGGGKSSMGRTATGAGNLANAVASRLQDPVENFLMNVYEPWLFQLDELNNERLPMSTLRQVLGDELEKDFKLDEENFLNARVKFEVLAGAHIAAKKTMAQAMPLMIQMFENPQLISELNKTGWTVDLKELLRMMFEVSEWKNQFDVIRRLTKEEMQALQANNPQAQKAQAQAAADEQKFGHAAALVDQKNQGRAANEVLRQTFEKAATPEAVEGEAGGKGFGSQI